VQLLGDQGQAEHNGRWQTEPLLALFRMLVPVFYSINVVVLVGLVFASIGRFTRHVAGVKMVLSRLLFAWFSLARFRSVVGHLAFPYPVPLGKRSAFARGAFSRLKFLGAG
jgi:hypothetical protein